MIKNKIILIPTITIIILLSVFISFTYGFIINKKTQENNYFCNKYCLIICGFIIISIGIVFNTFVFIQRNNKPLHLIV